MQEAIQQFIQTLSPKTAKEYARTYFNAMFTDEEVEHALPIIQQNWKQYLNPAQKDELIASLNAAAGIPATQKITQIANTLLNLFPLH